jgi:signal transduction histidine kinase
MLPAVCGELAVALLLALVILWGHLMAEQRSNRRERRCRKEMESYLRLDSRVGRASSMRDLAERVCSVVSAKSPFRRVAMLLRDADMRLYVAASTAMEPEAVEMVRQWAAVVHERQKDNRGGISSGVRLGVRSLVVGFGDGAERGIVVPLWSDEGQMSGGLVVMAASVLDVRREMAEEAVISLEALATKLARSIEGAEMEERLLRAEKLAGLGLLAGGIAHSLNNPLTTVMGYADLIGETASEERVRHDAQTILAEAHRMQETVESLIQFWRPSIQREEAVDVVLLVKEMAKECEAALIARDIRIVTQAEEGISPVRGNLTRLRLVLEHLLNNASQAIATARAMPGMQMSDRRDDAIRVTVSCDGAALRVIVSDTGTGFRDPGRVFDPFYTTQVLGAGSGLGLSICYGIVREHGGEISAFNLHPAGAAVVVELPVAETVCTEPFVVREVA